MFLSIKNSFIPVTAYEVKSLILEFADDSKLYFRIITIYTIKSKGYMKNHKLKELLNSIDIKADWIGIREVKELTTYRAVRDGNPKSNDRELTHGILVEVLSNGSG